MLFTIIGASAQWVVTRQQGIKSRNYAVGQSAANGPVAWKSDVVSRGTTGL